MKLDWTEEKIEKVKQLVDEYLISNNANSGEWVSQNDECQISALWDLACPLADVFEDDKYWDE